MVSKTVITLPGTDENSLCLRLTGTVDAADYEEFFYAPMRTFLAAGTRYNLYLLYDEKFTGWTEEAADLSFKCISSTVSLARRVAFVDAPDSRMLMMKIFLPVMAGEIRYFETDEAEQALIWVKEQK